jgi:phosphatidate cytidylyltransferase
MCLFEFYRLARGLKISPNNLLGMISCSLFFCISLFYLTGFAASSSVLIPLLFMYAIFVYFIYHKSEHTFIDLSFTFLGIFYITTPFVCLNFIVFYPDRTFSASIAIGYLLLIWIYDSGAYIVGSLCGKHKLFERISPKKTWEGLAGGSVFCLASAFLISDYFQHLSLFQWLIISILTIVTGTYGDLFKSILKRNVGFKDSGNVMPGHGGMLDRLDSFIFSAPFVLAYLLSLKSNN